MKKRYRTYVEFDFASAPFSPEILVGQVRRLADEFGRPGIEAKRRQKNMLVIPRGYLKTRWPTR